MSARRPRCEFSHPGCASPAHGGRGGAPDHGVHACALPPAPVPPPRRRCALAVLLAAPAASAAEGEAPVVQGLGCTGPGARPGPLLPRARRARHAGERRSRSRSPRSARRARRRRTSPRRSRGSPRPPTRTPPRPRARRGARHPRGRAAARPRLRRHPAAELERARQGQDRAGRRARSRSARCASPDHALSDAWLLDFEDPTQPYTVRYRVSELGGTPGGELTPAPLLADGSRRGARRAVRAAAAASCGPGRST